MFVLCRTSNPGAKDFEYRKLEDGRHVYDLVGDSLTALGSDLMGERGYSSVGLVIGGTHTEEAETIRAAYPHTFFLIPGYGAQGGKAADIARYMNKGNGGVAHFFFLSSKMSSAKPSSMARLAFIQVSESMRWEILARLMPVLIS